jgi:hypothetical protein
MPLTSCDPSEAQSSVVASRFLENLNAPVVSYLDFNDDNGRASWKSLFYLLYTVLMPRSHETSRFKFARTNPLEIFTLLGFYVAKNGSF